MNNIIFQSFIKDCRDVYGVSVLASACDVRRNQIYNWVNGKVSVPHQYHMDALKDFLTVNNNQTLLKELDDIYFQTDEEANSFVGNSVDKFNEHYDICLIPMDSIAPEDYLQIGLNFPTKEMFDYLFVTCLYGSGGVDRLWGGQSIAYKGRRAMAIHERFGKLSQYGLNEEFWKETSKFFVSDISYPECVKVHKGNANDRHGGNTHIIWGIKNATPMLVNEIVDTYQKTRCWMPVPPA